MKISTLIFGLFILGLSGISWAEPVYLKCSTSNPEQDFTERFTLKINERTGKITHSRSDGSAFIANGFFSADKISYKGKRLRTTFHYTIDRSNLKIRELMDTTIGTKHFKNERNGRCSIVEMKNRKI